jgi:hypothetical protein
LTFLELSNMNAALPTVSIPVPSRKAGTAIGLLAVMVICLMAAFPSYALDLVAFTGITGPLVAVLTQLAALSPAFKAIGGVVAFFIALLTLAALRNFSSVLFYLGFAVFAAVGLLVAGAIMGAVL